MHPQRLTHLCMCVCLCSRKEPSALQRVQSPSGSGSPHSPHGSPEESPQPALSHAGRDARPAAPARQQAAQPSQQRPPAWQVHDAGRHSGVRHSREDEGVRVSSHLIPMDESNYMDVMALKVSRTAAHCSLVAAYGALTDSLYCVCSPGAHAGGRDGGG